MSPAGVRLLLEQLSKRINYSGLDLSVEVDSVFNSFEVACSQRGRVVWVAEVGDGTVREIFSSPRYSAAAVYDVSSLLDLFTVLVSVFYSFVAYQIGLSGFLSLLLGSSVVSWKSYCVRVLRGTGLSVERSGQKLIVDGVVLRLYPPYLFVDGSYSYRVEAGDEMSLFCSLGAILSGILVLNDTDISLSAHAKGSLVEGDDEGSSDGEGGSGFSGGGFGGGDDDFGAGDEGFGAAGDEDFGAGAGDEDLF